jgi:hypothetical protein
MKRRRDVWIAAGLVVGSLCLALPAVAKTLNVQVQEGKLRASASPLGAVVGTAAYGDQMEVLEEKGPWIKVSKPDGAATGWMHTSELTKQSIKLHAGEKGADTAASSGEQALAGKGFSKDVEAAFKDKNKNVDFAWVDRMGKFKVSTQDLQAFLKQGHLKAAEGGAP